MTIPKPKQQSTHNNKTNTTTDNINKHMSEKHRAQHTSTAAHVCSKHVHDGKDGWGLHTYPLATLLTSFGCTVDLRIWALAGRICATVSTAVLTINLKLELPRRALAGHELGEEFSCKSSGIHHTTTVIPTIPRTTAAACYVAVARGGKTRARRRTLGCSSATGGPWYSRPSRRSAVWVKDTAQGKERGRGRASVQRHRQRFPQVFKKGVDAWVEEAGAVGSALTVFLLQPYGRAVRRVLQGRDSQTCAGSMHRQTECRTWNNEPEGEGPDNPNITNALVRFNAAVNVPRARRTCNPVARTFSSVPLPLWGTNLLVRTVSQRRVP